MSESTRTRSIRTHGARAGSRVPRSDTSTSNELEASQKLDRTSQQRGELNARYGGNGLALKVVGETIRELFAGAIGTLLQEAGDGNVFGGNLVNLLRLLRGDPTWSGTAAVPPANGASHSRTVRSNPPLASSRPSALTATVRMPPAWPCKAASSCPAGASHSRMVPSSPPRAPSVRPHSPSPYTPGQCGTGPPGSTSWSSWRQDFVRNEQIAVYPRQPSAQRVLGVAADTAARLVDVRAPFKSSSPTSGVSSGLIAQSANWYVRCVSQQPVSRCRDREGIGTWHCQLRSTDKTRW